MERETAATQDPGAPSELWLILQRLEDVNTHVKEARLETREIRHEIREVRQEIHEVRHELRELRQETRQEIQRLDASIDHLRRDNRTALLTAIGLWATVAVGFVTLFLRG